MAWLILFMLAGLLTSLSLFDAAIPLNYRILSPVFPLLFAVVGLMMHRLASPLRRRPRVRAVLIVAVGVSVAFRAFAVGRLIHDAANTGLGYAHKRWDDSRTLRFIKTLRGTGRRIYTDAPDLIYVRTGVESRPVPMSRFRTTGLPNTRRFPEMRKMARDAMATDGLIVYIDHVNRDDYLMTERNLKARLHLKLVRRFDGGRVYSVIDDELSP